MFMIVIQPLMHHLPPIIVLAVMHHHRVAYLIVRLAGASAPASVVSSGHFIATTYHKAP